MASLIETMNETARLIDETIAYTTARAAKAEIALERCRAALTSISLNTCCDRCQEAALVAKKALSSIDSPA